MLILTATFFTSICSTFCELFVSIKKNKKHLKLYINYIKKNIAN